MNYLLDTMIWLWSVDSVEKLNQECRDILENGREEIYFSADCLGDKHQGRAGQAASSGAARAGHTSIHGEAGTSPATRYAFACGQGLRSPAP